MILNLNHTEGRTSTNPRFILYPVASATSQIENESVAQRFFPWYSTKWRCSISTFFCFILCTEDAKLVRSFTVDGCRRRRGHPGRGTPKFRCDGNVGPPCIVKRGDTVYLDVDFGSGIFFDIVVVPFKDMHTKMTHNWLLKSQTFKLDWIFWFSELETLLIKYGVRFSS